MNNPIKVAGYCDQEKNHIIEKNRKYLNGDTCNLKNILVSIVICNHNGAGNLRRLFASMGSASFYKNYELIIVDNGSTDDSLACLSEMEPLYPLTVLRNPRNETFSKACNQGAVNAKGQYLLFLNNDIEVTDGWLDELLLAALEHPDAGAVGAKLIYPAIPDDSVNRGKSYKIQHGGISFHCKAFEGKCYIRPYNMGNGAPPFTDGSHEVTVVKAAVTGACLLMKKEVFCEIGGFDENYVYGYEDVDLCLKALRKGYRNYYCPSAVLFHYEFGTQQFSQPDEVYKRRKNNLVYFDRRWHAWLAEKIFEDKLHNEQYFTEESLVIAFAVTEANEGTAAGDYFTALELAEELGKLGYKTVYLSARGNKDWYDVGPDVDVLISMLDSYNLLNVKNAKPDLITVAWARNWFTRWCANPSIQSYTYIFASSRFACDYIFNNIKRNAYLFTIATNYKRFADEKNRPSDYFDEVTYKSDYVFTGSYWKDPREIVEFLHPENLPYKCRIFGKNWELLQQLAPYSNGFVRYQDMPRVYKYSKIAIDDANRVTKSWGSVNSRVYDAIAAGCLVITNGELGAKEQFGDALPVYHNQIELEALLTYFLEHEEERIAKVRELQKIVREGYTYDKRALQLKSLLENHYRINENKVAIIIAAPDMERARSWGDYYFALAIKRELEACNYTVEIRSMAESDWPFDGRHVLVLRGLYQYIPEMCHNNMMWNISHPDMVSVQEYNEYDIVYIASDYWASHIASLASTEVLPLLQCADPEVCMQTGAAFPPSEALFVGETRGIYRQVIRDIMPCHKNLAVYGGGWDKFIDKKYIKGQRIAHKDLGNAYRSCDILLNDHWPDMKEKGFISNRIFDGLAAGAFIITDEVKGLENGFDKYVVTYNGSEDLNNKIDYYLRTPQQRNAVRTRGREEILKNHMFKNRVGVILRHIREVNRKNRETVRMPADTVTMSVGMVKEPSVAATKPEGTPVMPETLITGPVTAVPASVKLAKKPAAAVQEPVKQVEEPGLVPAKPDADFYPAGYLEIYTDVKSAGMDPWEHYVKYGKKESRGKGWNPPSHRFLQELYLQIYPDVKRTGMDPWIHYIEIGKKEGRSSCVNLRFDGYDRFCAGILRDVDSFKRKVSRYKENSKTVSGLKIAVYTSISNHYDSLKIPMQLTDGVDYYCFTDTPQPDYGIWKILPCPWIDSDNTRTTRYVKTHPHYLLSEYDIAVWIDANLIINCNIREFLKPFIQSGKKVAGFRHPERNDIYEEAEVCIAMQKDRKEIIEEQVEAYRNDSFEHNDLIESNFIAFDLREKSVHAFLNMWWNEIDRYSKRDQLSLNYCLKKKGLDWYTIKDQGKCYRNITEILFRVHDRHKGIGATALESFFEEIDPYQGKPYYNLCEARTEKWKHKKIDVVICVHDALEDVKKCIASVLRHRVHEQVIIIDDGSSAATARYLKELPEIFDFITVVRHETAWGYTKSVNDGIKHSSGDMVILLNSDTVVTRLWVWKMADALYSTPGAGIVGPMSNAASMQSMPSIFATGDNTAINLLPENLDADAVNRFCEQWTVEDVVPRVPLVHGFCFGIARECINAIGGFDEVNFPMGYGEENDYCFRAANAGFSLVIATHTFIYHAKSKSFTDVFRRRQLMEHGRKKLQELYGVLRITRSVETMKKDPLLDRFRSNAWMVFREREELLRLNAEENTGKRNLAGEIRDKKEDRLQTSSVKEVSADYMRMRKNGIDIIVPVYGDLEATETCIHSVLERTGFPFRLILINDCSPEPGMKKLLDDFAEDERVVLLENMTNLGFPATVNRGFGYSDRDVVILNSDTEVFNGWLENMVRAAAANPDAATVTPYSSNSGVFTLFSEQIAEKYSYLTLAKAVSCLFEGTYPEVPVGNGFCMLIRRAALRMTGLFDVVRFGRGYGEESDFCMRCRNFGFRHIADPSTYIFHKRSVSFKEEAVELRAAHNRILEELHPEYRKLVWQFKNDADWNHRKELLTARVMEFLNSGLGKDAASVITDERRSLVQNKKKRFLVVMHRGKGGSIQNRMDLMSGMADTCDSYLLTGDWHSLLLEFVSQGKRIPVRYYELSTPLDFQTFEREDIREIYAEILFLYQIDYVNMSHLLGQTFDIVKECRDRKIPCLFMMHDYYTVCPNFSLLDPKNRYCGGKCRAGGRECFLPNKWFKNLKTTAEEVLPSWRQAMAGYLQLFDFLCAPSCFCADTIENIYPGLKGRIQVIEHGRDFGKNWRVSGSFPSPGEKIRILIPGNISISKGMFFLMKLLEFDKEKRLELHVVGNVDKRLVDRGLILHGEYTRETLPEIVKNIRPHYGFVPSIYPETYCHTLTELWAMGLPSVVFAVGVPEARMKESGAGWICPVEDVEGFYKLVTEKITKEEYEQKAKMAEKLTFPSVRDMADRYLSMFENCAEPPVL